MLILFILAAIAVGVWYYTEKYTTAVTPLLTKVKKIEAEVKVVADVNQDGKIDIKDVQAATEVVKKVRKPRAKKNTKKKGL